MPQKGIIMKNPSLTSVLCAVAVLTLASTACAQTFICNNIPDYFTKRCTIHPYAITRVVNGMVEKGHLVGCQFKSWSCLKLDGRYQCKDNYGTAVVPFDFPMTDLSRFCSLLCTAPSCTGTWQ
jgi:hypothetical protein